MQHSRGTAGTEHATVRHEMTSDGGEKLGGIEMRKAKKTICAAIASTAMVIAWAMSASPASATACFNEAVREQQSSTYLPECRGYELVSPAGTTPFLASDGEVRGQGASTGASIAWFTYYPATAHGGFYELSRRGATGWSTGGVTPATSSSSGNNFACEPSLYFSADLASAAVEDGFQQAPAEEGYCGSNDPPLVTNGEPQGAQDLFLRDSASGAYRLVNMTPPGVTPANAYFEDASVGFDRIYFEEEAQLTPNAPSGRNLYEWSEGAVHLATLLPEGAAVNGRVVAAPYLHGVSADGRRVFFEAGGNLYVRINPESETEVEGVSTVDECGMRACTIQLDASRAGGAGGGGRFMAARPDGEAVFFSDNAAAKLTSDTQEGSGANLYEYNLQTGILTDLTSAPAADVLGVSAIGGNDAYLYFVAEGVLAAGAAAGMPNLYVAHGAALSFIGTLGAEDHADWESPGMGTSVSPDGRYFAFDSVESLTGYDNVDSTTGSLDTEVFLYDAAAGGAPTCASCNPSGAAPVGPASLPRVQQLLSVQGPGYDPRSLLNGGQLFFDSSDALLSRDINHRYDVYEYVNGAAQLISSGTGSEDARFVDASEKGEDVFFVTGQELIAADTDTQLSLYDARVEGGFAEVAAASSSCSGEGCRGTPPVAPGYLAPASIGFSGPGNLPALRTAQKAKAGKSRFARRRHRALEHCRRKFADNRHRQRLCKRLARHRLGGKAARSQRRRASFGARK